MKKYPMTYEEFKEKCIAHARKYLGYSEAVNTYLAGEEAETIIRDKYEEECNYYDGHGIYSESKCPPFNDGAIAACEYELNMCCDY